MPTIHTTLQRRGYLSKQGHADLDRVMRRSCRLYNAAMENFRNSYPRSWTTVPAETGKGLTFDGSQWQRNAATGVWFNEVGDPLKVTGQEPDASLYAMYSQLTGIRADDDGWADLDLSIGRGVLQRLQRAKNDFFRRCRDGEIPGYPRFKSAARWRTIELAEVPPRHGQGQQNQGKGPSHHHHQRTQPPWSQPAQDPPASPGPAGRSPSPSPTSWSGTTCHTTPTASASTWASPTA